MDKIKSTKQLNMQVAVVTPDAKDEKDYFSFLCKSNNIEIELIDKLLQTEHKYRYQLKRSDIFTDIEEIAQSYALGKINNELYENYKIA